MNNEIINLVSMIICEGSSHDALSMGVSGIIERRWIPLHDFNGNGAQIAQAILTGDGIDKPSGIENCSEINHTESELTADVMIDLIYSIPSRMRQGASFILPVVRNPVHDARMLKDADGRFLWEPALSATETPRMLGFPAYISHHASSIIFGNFKSGYMLTANPSRSKFGGDVVYPAALARLSTSG